jgi:hypothetical protein
MPEALRAGFNALKWLESGAGRRIWLDFPEVIF